MPRDTKAETALTSARIKELRALISGLPPSPWTPHRRSWLRDDTGAFVAEVQFGNDSILDFIAAARDALPAALDEIERLRGLLWFAWSEFNAIRARSGAPLAHDGMTTCDESWWSEMTDKFADAIGPEAHRPWPSVEAKSILDRQQQYEDAKRLRAEVERLRAENAALVEECEIGMKNIADCYGDIERLREALTPFAREADTWGNSIHDDNRPLIGRDFLADEFGGGYVRPGSETFFTIGDLRRARAALQVTDDPQAGSRVAEGAGVKHKEGGA